MCPIRAHALLVLIHIDFTSVESTMELNKPPSVVTKDQMAKTVAKVLYERFISVFGVPVRLLSDHRANFTSALVEELCTTFGIQKC